MGGERSTNPLRFAAIMALVGLVAAPAPGQVTFELLETPENGRWADFSLSRDGTNMGCLLGGAVYWWSARDGFRHLDDGSPTLGGVGMSARGNALIATRKTAAGTVPAIWFGDGTSLELGAARRECAPNPRADLGYDLNADGTVAVGRTRNCAADEAFVWSRDAGPRTLTSAAGSGSRGAAVSADGRKVVGYCEHPEKGYRQPALWRDGGQPVLFLGHDRAGEALNISLDGSMVVGQAELGGLSPQAFLWLEGQQPVVLGNLSGRATDSSQASAVSDNGQVVGWSGDELWGDQEAFIWNARVGMRSLNDLVAAHGIDLPAGLTLTDALDISGDGSTVVGVCRDRYWNQLYWRLRLDGTLDTLPVVAAPPQGPPTVAPVPADSLGVQRAEILAPFPFGKNRY